jgi:hypothetical protein
VTQSGSSGHSPDSRWWWNGERWLPAYTADGRWWFDGNAWVIPYPAWRRWTLPTGLAMFIIGFVGSTIGFVMVAGDPGPGDPVKPDPGWLGPVAITTSALWLIGIGLLLASPIQQMRAARARKRLGLTESARSHVG